MIRVPGMLMLGAAGRNTGKTELACSIIGRFCADHEIVGAKVTTVLKKDGTCPRGGRGCGVCSSLEGEYCITEETDPPPDKDTARLLAAGAVRVYWLRVMRRSLDQGLEALLEAVGPETLTVCESNSLRLEVEPDLFLVTTEKGSDECKASAGEVMQHADRIVVSDGESFDLDLADIDVLDGGWAMRADASAIIMAGGESLRMGRDKAVLDVGGRPLIEQIRDRVRPHFKEIVISAADAGAYAFLGERVVPDLVGGQGPLMGIVSALEACEHDRAFVVACDMPELDVTLMKRLLRESRAADAVIPVAPGGHIEPLFAVYTKAVLPAARAALDSGERRIRSFFGDCELKYVHVATGPRNLNTPQDWKEYTAKP